MWAKLTNHWFLTALAICFAVGYLASESIEPWLEQTWIRSGVMFSVMWAMGVTLPAETIRRSLAKPLPAGLAIGINMLLVPLLALPTAYWLSDSQFGGLFVASMVPCTLAGASVWTRKAGGDDSVAMMTTVVTNLACIVVAPLGIWVVLSEQVQIQAAEQVGKLTLLVVTPLVLAQWMRRLGCRQWADRNKSTISGCAQVGILVMVTLGAAASGSTSGSGSDPAESSWGAFAWLLVTALMIHLLALGAGVLAARTFRLDRARQIAVGISGSQKTLMVGLQIAIDLGVSVVPMLIYHLGQLSLDTLIAQWWKGRNRDGT